MEIDSEKVSAESCTWLDADYEWGGHVWRITCPQCWQVMTINTGRGDAPKCQCGLTWEVDVVATGSKQERG